MMDTRIIPEGNMAEKTMPPATNPPEKKTASISAIVRSAAAAFLSAGAINAALFFSAEAMDVRFAMRAPSAAELQAITIVNVVAAIAVGVAGAAIAFWAIARFSKRPDVIFQGVSFAVLLASFAAPFTLASESDLFGKAILVLMHVVVAVTVVPMLLRTLRTRP